MLRSNARHGWLTQFFGRRGRGPTARRPTPRRLAVEPLELRLAPATSAFFSMPTSLTANQGTVVTVPVSINHLSDANGNSGLNSADVVLTYDPTVFTVSTSDVSQGSLLTNPPPNGTWNFVVNTATPGEIDLTVSSSGLAADVTNTTGGVLANINLHVKGAAPTGNSSIHVVVPPGTSPNGLSSDADPHAGPNSIQGDATGYTLDPADQVDGVVNVQNFAPVTTLSIPTNLSGNPSQTITVPVNISNPDPNGSAGMISADAAILYDPTKLTVAATGAVKAGSDVPASGWTVTYGVDTSGTNGVDATKAALGLHLINTNNTPLTTTSAGSLWLVTFTINSGAASGTTALNLVPSAKVGVSTTTTNVTGQNKVYQLSPPPTNAANDSVDGLVTISSTGLTAALDGNGNLVVTDNLTSGQNDTFKIQSDTANSQFILTDGGFPISTSIPGASGSGTTTVTIPFNSVSGTQILLNRGAATDNLTVDFALGTFSKSITFDGGGGNNSLTINGGAFTTTTYDYTGAHDGDVVLGSAAGTATVTYKNLTPINNTGTATDVVFNLPSGANMTVGDTAVPGQLQLVSNNASFENTSFKAPTNSLTINTGGGTSVVNLPLNSSSGTLNHLASPLTVNAAAGSATLNVSLDNYAGAATEAVAISGSQLIDSTFAFPINYTTTGGTFGGGINVTTSATKNATITIAALPANAPLAITAGAGFNTLVGPDTALDWTISGPNRGEFNAVCFFSNVQNLVGGNQQDRYIFSPGGSIAGTIDGGVGSTDLLDYTGFGSSVLVNLNTQTATAVGGTFTNIEGILGSAATDSLVGANAANTWTLDPTGGINSTLVANATLTMRFDGFENLTGGSDTDVFQFDNNESIPGTVDGGGGLDTLDYSGYTASGVVVNLPTNTATGTGSVLSFERLIGSAGNDLLIGNTGGNTAFVASAGTDTITGLGAGGNTLTGADTPNTWNLTVTPTLVSGASTTSFTNIQHVIGGSDTDAFSLDAAGSATTRTIDGGDGADSLTVTFSAGMSGQTITYNGGGQAGDALAVNGLAATTLTLTLLPDSGGHQGSVNADGTVFNYTGLAPVTLGGTVTNVVINLPTGDGDNQAILEDNGNLADGISQIRSGNGTFETTTFPNPSGSVTINTGGDGETVTVSRLDNGFTAPITVDAGAGADSLVVDFSSGVDVIPSGGITLSGAGGNDGVRLLAGYAATTVTDNYTDGADGSIVVDGRTVVYSGINAATGLRDLLTPTNRVFNFPATDDTLTLGDDGTAGDGLSEITSTFSSPATVFGNPGLMLTVNGGLGADTINAGPVDSLNPPGFINLNGFNGTDVAADGSDTFNVTPSTASSFSIDGDQPTPPALPGDTLNVNTAGTTGPFLSVTSTATGFQGTYTFGNRQPVSFKEIERFAPATTDLSITKTDGQTTATPGTPITYTITATNVGALGVGGVTVTDTFPATLTNVQWTASFTSGSFGAASGTGDINQPVDLAAGGSVTYTVTATIAPSATGTLSNTATVTPPAGVTDSNPANNSATDDDGLLPSADLVAGKTGPATVTAGTDITYTLSVTNNGPSDAQGVTLTDAVPAGTTFVSESQTSGPTASFTTPAVGGTGTTTADVGTLAAGQSATFVLVVHASASDPDGSTVTNTAVAGSTTGDSKPGNNSASVVSNVATVADLAVTKVGPATVTAGTNVTYTISLTNNGPSDAQLVSLTDVVPADTTFVSFVQTSGPAFTLSTPAVGGTGTASATVSTFAAGDSAAFVLVLHVRAAAPDGGSIANKATAASSTFDNTPGNNSATSTATVATAADLVVTKAGPATVTAGTNITYTLSLTNNGPSDAQSVSLTDALPANTTFVSQTQSAGPTFTTSTPAVGSGGTVSDTISTLAAGASATFVLVVRADSGAPDGSSIANTATGASATTETTPADNSDTSTASVVARADLAVTKTGPATVTAGTNLTYTISLTNNGPSDAQSVSLTDTLPAHTTFVSETQTSGPSFTTSSPPVGGTGTFSATISSVAAGQSATFQLVVHVNADTPDATALGNTASASSSTVDLIPDNNSSTASTGVATAADLVVTKTGPAAAVEGQNVTYTITVVNNGPSDAQAVVVTDTLPANAAFVSTTFPAGSTTSTATSITTNLGTVAAGATVSGTYVITLKEEGSADDKAVVSSSTTETTPGDNTATATTNVTDAALSATGTTISPTEGEPFTGTVATFTDANTFAGTADFTVTIAWGDGQTSAGTVTGSAGSFTVSGSHTYTEDGSFTVSVSIKDKGGSTASATTTSTVTAVPIVATGVPLSGNELTPLENVLVATFTHAHGLEPVTGFSSTIDWGDGTTSAGTVALDGTTYFVRGSHTYGDEGSFRVQIRIVDGAATASATTTVRIDEELLANGTRGSNNQLYVNELYRDLLGRKADPGGLQTWVGLLAGGATRQQVAADIVNSNEYRTRVVDSLYQTFLHRHADAVGLNLGTQFLALGKSTQDLAAVIAASPEYFQNRGGGTNDGFLDAAYQDIFSRAVDPGARSTFDGALKAGFSRAEVLSAIFASDEYRHDLNEQLYERFLDRHADPGGDELALQAQKQGIKEAQVIITLAASEEFFNKTLP